LRPADDSWTLCYLAALTRKSALAAFPNMIRSLQILRSALGPLLVICAAVTLVSGTDFGLAFTAAAFVAWVNYQVLGMLVSGAVNAAADPLGGSPLWGMLLAGKYGGFLVLFGFMLSKADVLAVVFGTMTALFSVTAAAFLATSPATTAVEETR